MMEIEIPIIVEEEFELVQAHGPDVLNMRLNSLSVLDISESDISVLNLFNPVGTLVRDLQDCGGGRSLVLHEDQLGLMELRWKSLFGGCSHLFPVVQNCLENISVFLQRAGQL